MTASPLFATTPGKGSRQLYFVRWINRRGQEETKVYFSRVHLVKKVESLREQGLPLAVWHTAVEWIPIDPATITVPSTREA